MLDTYIQMLARFADAMSIANNKEPDTEVMFVEGSEIILHPDICKLNEENRNNLLHYLVDRPI